MKIRRYHTGTLIFLISMLLSCRQSTDHKIQAANDVNETPIPTATLRRTVLTAAIQKALTPDKIIQELAEGNQNYQQNHITPKNDTSMMRQTIEGQYPEAFILACMDSRVPVEEIFDKGIGDVFVGRVAGNIIDNDILGSMEYGCKLAGAKLVVVMGHESCGAVKAAIENENLGNVTSLLARLKPAIQQARRIKGEHTVENPVFVTEVVKQNVLNSIRQIRLESKLLKEMEDEKKIKIVGAYYDLHTGHVSFFNG